MRRAAMGWAFSLCLWAGGAAKAQLWWERGADTWYYKDDWKGAAVFCASRGGGPARVTKTIEVPEGAASGWIVVWGDRGYRLLAGDQVAGESEDPCLIDDFDLTRHVRGSRSVRLSIQGSKVCAEGEIVGAEGKRYPFATGADWEAGGGGSPRTEKMVAGPSRGAYDRAHNGRLMMYNEEERGKTAIAKCLGRIQRLDEQGLFLLKRYRSAEEILSFEDDQPWRRAERLAAGLAAEARSILTAKAIPAQKAGDFAGAIARAAEAAALIYNAEGAVGSATRIYLAEREITHLENLGVLLAKSAPTPPGVPKAPRPAPEAFVQADSVENLRRRAVSARRAHALGDWVSADKATGEISDLARGLRSGVEAAARPSEEIGMGRRSRGLIGGAGALDEFPEDRLGWLNARELMGNDPARWPFTVLPSANGTMDLSGLWDFRADPENVGESQGWHSRAAGEGWRKLVVPGPWERQGVNDDHREAPRTPMGKGTTGGDKPYNGFAWYRKTLLVPESWRGKDLVFLVGKIQNWSRIFWGGEPIGQLEEDSEARRLSPPREVRIPAARVTFGAENVLAIQVYNHDNFGGILLGPVALCPDGARPSSRETPGPLSYARECESPTPGGTVRHALFWSALSPATAVACDRPELEIQGWEPKGFQLPEAVEFPAADGVRRAELREPREIAAGNALSESWFHLRGASGDALILLERKPERVAWKKNELGFMSLFFSFGEHRQIRAVILPFPAGSAPSEEERSFWVKALRACPVSASECVRATPLSEKRDRRRDEICYIRYNYWRLDPEGAAPLLVAPIPMLLSYRLQYVQLRLREPQLLSIFRPRQARKTGYASPHAPYLVVEGSDTVEYPWPFDQPPSVPPAEVRKGVGELFARSRVEANVHGGLGEKAMLQRMAEWGFDHCRYAIAFQADWDLPLVKSMEGPILEGNEANWKRLDALVANCNAAGMQMMLCWFSDISTRRWKDHPEARQTAYELWRRLAKRYEPLPDWAISYDFFNEPAYMNREHWNEVIQELTAIIRAEDKKHTIVWESADGWAQPHWCLWMEPAKDDNVLYSFHHYGKHWGYAYDEYYPGYQCTHERTHVDPWLEAILFGIRHGVPIHCGEFGLSMIQPARDGEAWLDDYLAFFERFGIGWNWWNYSGGDIYRTGLAAGDRISPYVPILRKWMNLPGRGSALRPASSPPVKD